MALRRAWCSSGADRHGRSSGSGHVLRRFRLPRRLRARTMRSRIPKTTDGWSLSTARNGLIEIDLGNRRRIRVDAQVDPEALARVLDGLERR